MKWLFLYILLFVSVAEGASRDESERILHAGQQISNLQDSIDVKGTTADTSRSFWLGAVDNLALFVKYDNRSTTCNIKIDLDISPDNLGERSIFGTNWSFWGTLDEINIGGGAGSVGSFDIPNPPLWARYGRLRVTGYMAVTDSSKVTTKVIRTYLSQ